MWLPRLDQAVRLTRAQEDESEQLGRTGLVNSRCKKILGQPACGKQRGPKYHWVPLSLLFARKTPVNLRSLFVERLPNCLVIGSKQTTSDPRLHVHCDVLRPKCLRCLLFSDSLGGLSCVSEPKSFSLSLSFSDLPTQPHPKPL